MKILTVFIGAKKAPIPCLLRDKPELDLGVVRPNEHTARDGGKTVAVAILSRYSLEVRLRARHSPRRRPNLSPGGVDPAIDDRGPVGTISPLLTICVEEGGERLHGRIVELFQSVELHIRQIDSTTLEDCLNLRGRVPVNTVRIKLASNLVESSPGEAGAPDVVVMECLPCLPVERRARVRRPDDCRKAPVLEVGDLTKVGRAKFLGKLFIKVR